MDYFSLYFSYSVGLTATGQLYLLLKMVRVMSKKPFLGTASFTLPSRRFMILRTTIHLISQLLLIYYIFRLVLLPLLFLFHRFRSRLHIHLLTLLSLFLRFLLNNFLYWFLLLRRRSLQYFRLNFSRFRRLSLFKYLLFGLVSSLRW